MNNNAPLVQIKHKETKMKTRKTMFGIFTAVEGGKEAAVTKPNGVFAKQKLLLLLLAWTLIAIGCDNGDKETHTHQWEWVDTKAATATAEGEETETCATCGQTTRTRPIQKLPEQPQARTAEKIEFGTDLYTNVSCEKPLLNAEWTAVKTKFTTALDSASKSGGDLGSACTSIFKGAANIDLVTTTEYSYYKLSTGKLLLNADYVIDATADDLLAKISTAVNAAFDDSLPSQQ
jgi:hypothetical protein